MENLPELVNNRLMVTMDVCVKSAGYSAPELDSCRHSPKTDVYAYGVVSITYIQRLWFSVYNY